MIHEQAQIISIYPDSLWVEPMDKTACDACTTEKSCGKKHFRRVSKKAVGVKVLLNGRRAEDFQVNQLVTIGISENVLMKGTFLVYLTPLLALMLGAGLGEFLYRSDASALAGATLGLIAGSCLVKWFSGSHSANLALNPVLIDDSCC